MDIAAYDSTVCKECKELCNYYLDEYWNCQGEPEPCEEFFNRRTMTGISSLKRDYEEHCDEEMRDYCEAYEETYNPEDGSM